MNGFAMRARFHVTKKKNAYVKALEPADHHHVVGHFGHDGHDVKGPRQRLHVVLERAAQVVRVGGIGAQVAIATPSGENVQSFLSVAHQISQQQLVPNATTDANKQTQNKNKVRKTADVLQPAVPNTALCLAVGLGKEKEEKREKDTRGTKWIGEREREEGLGVMTTPYLVIL